MALSDLLTVNPTNIVIMLKDYAILHGVVYLFGKVVRPSRLLVKTESDRLLHGHQLYGHKGSARACRRAHCVRIRMNSQQPPIEHLQLVTEQLLPEFSLEHDI